jgi:hypothetical protein
VSECYDLVLDLVARISAPTTTNSTVIAAAVVPAGVPATSRHAQQKHEPCFALRILNRLKLRWSRHCTTSKLVSTPLQAAGMG